MEKSCITCGFLASRNRKTRALDETEPETRETGWIPLTEAGGDHIYHPPICYMGKCDLWSESGIRHPEAIAYGDEVKIRDRINYDRNCDEWIEWKQGLTPKEHMEMIDRKFIMEMDEKRRRNDRKWHWIELFAIILGTGLFTLLGAWIARMN